MNLLQAGRSRGCRVGGHGSTPKESSASSLRRNLALLCLPPRCTLRSAPHPRPDNCSTSLSKCPLSTCHPPTHLELGGGGLVGGEGVLHLHALHGCQAPGVGGVLHLRAREAQGAHGSGGVGSEARHPGQQRSALSAGHDAPGQPQSAGVALNPTGLAEKGTSAGPSRRAESHGCNL